MTTLIARQLRRNFMVSILDPTRAAGVVVRRWRAAVALLIVAVLLVSGQVAPAGATARSGLVGDTRYVSEQFVFELEWDAPWEAGPDTVDSEPGTYDFIAVAGPDGVLRCILWFTSDLEGMLNATIDARAETFGGAEVVDWDEGTTALGLPYYEATITYESTGSNGQSVTWLEYVEVSLAYTADLGHGALVASLVAPAGSLADTFNDAQDTFVYNQGEMGPLFSGQPVDDGNSSSGGRADDDDRGSRDRDRSERGGASEAGAEYLATLGAEIDALTESVDRFYALLNDPDFGDQATLQELSEILNGWIDAFEYAQSLTPPRGYEEVHAAYVDFTGYLAGAATALFDQDLSSAIVMLEQALQQGVYLADLLADASG
jgi:hypothetical protein